MCCNNHLAVSRCKLNSMSAALLLQKIISLFLMRCTFENAIPRHSGFPAGKIPTASGFILPQIFDTTECSCSSLNKDR